jgi:ABC-type polysaccharide/polyol phosphate transport system ATPase subunit
MTPCLRFERVSKRYRVGSGFRSLRDLFARRGDTKSPKYHEALDDVTFDLSPGDALGLIGPNGAGKTTILKILSRVTRPTSGDVRVNGRLSALIELGAGFHPDLTGRENIYLNGTILGMRKSDIRARFDQIVDFAGVGTFLETPVKRYSSGMYARLGFAIAAHLDPDVLLVDEVLAVGDYAFQQKCHARMDELRARGTALILVSHNMDAVRRVCNRGLVMYRGKNIFQGTAAEAIVTYSDALRSAARIAPTAVPTEGGLSERVMTFDAEIETVTIRNEDGHPVNVLRSGGSATIAVDVKFNGHVKQPVFSLTVRTTDGYIVYDTTTRWMGIATPDFSPGDRCQATFNVHIPLLAGEYEVGVDVAASDFSHYYDRMERALGFSVDAPGQAQGVADLAAEFRCDRMPTIEVQYVGSPR